MLDSDHLKNLQLLGLSLNQAKIYLCLVSNTSLSTAELITQTSIPRTTIYSELQTLEEKNWILREDGRPILYSAISPEIVYQRATEKITRTLSETESVLKAKWEEKANYQTQTISIIEGDNYLLKETIDSILKAQHSIILILRFLYPNEIQEIIKELKIQKSRGRLIKCVVFPEVYHSLNPKIQDELKKINTKLGPVPMRALIIDSDFVILSFLSEFGQIHNTESVKITYTSFVELLKESFNITFEKFNSPN